eukprot:g42589.t1
MCRGTPVGILRDIPRKGRSGILSLEEVGEVTGQHSHFVSLEYLQLVLCPVQDLLIRMLMNLANAYEQAERKVLVASLLGSLVGPGARQGPVMALRFDGALIRMENPSSGSHTVLKVTGGLTTYDELEAAAVCQWPGSDQCCHRTGHRAISDGRMSTGGPRRRRRAVPPGQTQALRLGVATRLEILIILRIDGRNSAISYNFRTRDGSET